MDRACAESYIYRSYLKAEKYHDRNEKDEKKRHPELSRELLRRLSENTDAESVVVTGSKGKGSVAVMISQILQTAYRVGLMTSPHLIDFCERFRVNGNMIEEADFLRLLEARRPDFEAIEAGLPESVGISPMAFQTALALDYFQERNAEFEVFECGKGAKYDDVNNVKHGYAVINHIFLEHTRELGETLEQIAEDKAHVITGEQKCVYVAAQEEGVMEVILERAEQMKVPVKRYGADFRAENICFDSQGMKFDVVIGKRKFQNLWLPLLGEHQAENCALAMAFCMDVMREISEPGIREALAGTRWPGRMEIIRTHPLTILDACIHPQSCQAVKKVLDKIGVKKVTLIAGIPDDKDYAGVVREMQPYTEHLILTRSQNPHYLFSDAQSEKLQKMGIASIRTESVSEAFSLADQKKCPILILGTTSVVGEVTEYTIEKKWKVR